MRVTGVQEICDLLLELSKNFQYWKKGITDMVQSFARSHLESQTTAQCPKAINSAWTVSVKMTRGWRAWLGEKDYNLQSLVERRCKDAITPNNRNERIYVEIHSREGEYFFRLMNNID